MQMHVIYKLEHKFKYNQSRKLDGDQNKVLSILPSNKF